MHENWYRVCSKEELKSRSILEVRFYVKVILELIFKGSVHLGKVWRRKKPVSSKAHLVHILKKL